MTLGIYEFYNKNIHGGNNIDMNNKLLLSYKVPLREFYNNDYKDYLINMKKFYYTRVDKEEYNKSISNYENIIKNNKYYKLNILKELQLSTGELSCIDKTFYLRLLQRKFKNYYKKNI